MIIRLSRKTSPKCLRRSKPALDKLELVDCSDPATHEVGKLIIDFANATLSGCAVWHCSD
jgi:hypothetical protein